MEKDNDFINSKDDEILMMSDHDSDTVITTEERIKEKQVNRKRKAKSNAIAAPSKRNKIVAKPGTHLNCDICNVNLSRKDNLYLITLFAFQGRLDRLMYYYVTAIEVILGLFAALY